MAKYGKAPGWGTSAFETVSVQPRGTHLIDEINHLEMRTIAAWEGYIKKSQIIYFGTVQTLFL